MRVTVRNITSALLPAVMFGLGYFAAYNFSQYVHEQPRCYVIKKDGSVHQHQKGEWMTDGDSLRCDMPRLPR